MSMSPRFLQLDITYGSVLAQTDIRPDSSWYRRALVLMATADESGQDSAEFRALLDDDNYRHDRTIIKILSRVPNG
jgi:hypothetical protein